MEGLEKGRVEGIEAGKQAEKKQMAKKLYLASVDIELIKQLTQLTESEIKAHIK